MKYKLKHDNERNFLRVEILDSLNAEDIRSVMEEIEKTFAGKKQRNILADLSAESSRDGSIPKETRAVYKEYLEKNIFDKVAVLGANSIVRMVAKIILATMRKSYDARFFKAEKEALEWLAGETK